MINGTLFVILFALLLSANFKYEIAVSGICGIEILLLI